MSRRTSLRHSILPGYPALGLPLIVAAAFAAPVYAGTGLQLSYSVGSKHDKHIAAPVARAMPAIDARLRLEYEMVIHVDNMIRTTGELHAIIEAMPGPNLPARKTPPPPPPPVMYASPLEETLARIDHVAQLIEDITRIIESMPAPSGRAPTNGLDNAVSASQPEPAMAAMSAAPPPTLPPRPPPVPDPEVTTTSLTTRTMALIGGGLAATALGFYLRRRYLRRRPTIKEIAAAIDPPPLKDEAIELADVMISMGIAGGAAQALVEHIHANPRSALSHWLKLLDVYRQSGKQDEFENAVEEIRTAFNVCPGSWNARGKNVTPKSSLEDYPHIALQLKKLWPTPDCGDYLLSLLADNRGGKRIGFPVAVVEEIILLLAVLRTIVSGFRSNEEHQNHPLQKTRKEAGVH